MLTDFYSAIFTDICGYLSIHSACKFFSFFPYERHSEHRVVTSDYVVSRESLQWSLMKQAIGISTQERRPCLKRCS